MWRLPEDRSEPVFSAKDQLSSAHRECRLRLPPTAIVFFMGQGAEYLCARYPVRELPEPFPRFLNRCPVWEMKDAPICFLHGGSGAPMAADTVETLAALGVMNILAVGMFGAFDTRISAGEIIAPDRAFVEEGTSLHYYETIDFSVPDGGLLAIAFSEARAKKYPVVSTDAVYRQTYYKEQVWRQRGAVGVDMETSAVFSVSSYLGLRAAALLMASDLHPQAPDAPKWTWRMTKEMRYSLTEMGLAAARRISEM